MARKGLRLALDAHVLVWLYMEPNRLRGEVLEAIRNPVNWKGISPAMIWEIAIKRAQGRLRTPADLAGRVLSSGFEPIPITFSHAEEAGALPRLHGDPFDRMLIAQARAESLTIVTADHRIARYDVDVLAT